MWILDLASNFRLVYVFVVLSCALLTLLLRHYRCGAALSLVLILIGLRPLVMWIPSPSARVATLQQVRLLNFNTEFQHNDNRASFARVIHDSGPDLIAISEVDQKWLDGLKGELKDYPSRVVCLEGPGMALFSKAPIEWHEVRFFGKSHHPRILAIVRSNFGRLDVLVAHPTTPKTQSGFDERNREMEIVAAEAKQMVPTRVIMGDLNCGPWSAYFSRLLSAADVRDSEQGFGAQPSWPARDGRIYGLLIPPLIPIDHVLVGQSLVVLARQTCPAVGSDHLPVLVTLGAVP